MTKKLTKRERRILRQEGVIDINNKINHAKFGIVDITRHYTLTEIQKKVISAYDDNYHIVLHGVAGTGKTFLSLFLALQEVLEGHDLYNKVCVFRSVVPTRDMGYLPGNWKQKAAVYEEPYKMMANELFKRGDAYEVLKNKNLLEFITTSFIRGTTFNNTIMIVDEINNMNFHELDSIMTRVGKNCKILFCGDYRQSDLKESNERQGLGRFLDILNNMGGFKRFEFTVDDIVRSDLVKDYIIQKTELGHV
jgi:phosphate starvation-inducible protein PhoH and related proteins|tara:strand:+ start:6380 stop:7129 length:750 start_codon:yes stop_codon:yes gene_type:complete